MALSLNLVGILIATGNTAWPSNPFAPILAIADDHDDEGDSDDDDEADEDDDDDDREERAPPLPDAAPDQIIVAGLDEDARTALLADAFEVLDEDDGLVLLRIPAGMSVEQALAALTAIAPAALAAPNAYYRNQAEVCGADICASWNQVGWPPATARLCSFSPFIGMVDSGVNLDHDMLGNADIQLERLAAGPDEPSELRHGTAVAAIIAGAAGGRVPGLAPDARLYVVDPFVHAPGGDERADAFGLIRALDLLVGAGVDVINLSLAGPSNGLLAASIERAAQAGIPVVAAVGNAGPQATPLYPAAYDSVIAVSAVDGNGTIYRRAVQGPHVDFVAPGVSIATAASISGVRPQTGTSFAAPFVTVAVAAAQRADPEVAAMIPALARDSRDLGEAGHDPVFGWGLIQLPDPCASEPD